MNTTDWRLPLRCPRCDAEGGHPFSVQSNSASEVVVTVRCDSCENEWQLERETPTLAPPRDRGITPEDTAE
jgi:Transcription factor S-II (TFIIS)